MASNSPSLIVLALVCALGAADGSAFAQDKPPCEQFDWSVKREQSLFSATNLPAVATGGTAGAPGSVALQLQPNAAVPFPLPPSRQPKSAESFGGVLTVQSIPKAGLYQVTLSNEAWIDLIQDDRILASASFSGKRGCPEVRKSVRFNLQAGKATIEISGAPENKINIAILPAE